MGWETHGVCVKSDGGRLGEVHHSVTSKKKITLLDYFKRCPALSYPPTLPTLTSMRFFVYLLHTSVGIVELRHINPTLGNFIDSMCYASLCFDMCFSSADSPGSEVPLSREEEVDLTLLKNDSGVESALLYAKAWSKYIKDLLAWMEKRLAMGETIGTILRYAVNEGLLLSDIVLDIMWKDVMIDNFWTAISWYKFSPFCVVVTLK